MQLALDRPPNPRHGDPVTQTAIEQVRKPLRVFPVDDSPLIRERLMEEIAVARETEFVGCAESESEALAKLSRLECDVIVLDLNLGQGSGFEVLRAVRANRTRRPHVIVLTSYAYPYYRHLTMEMGVDFFLDKATHFKLLLQIIEGLPAADEAESH